MSYPQVFLWLSAKEQAGRPFVIALEGQHQVLVNISHDSGPHSSLQAMVRVVCSAGRNSNFCDFVGTFLTNGSLRVVGIFNKGF